MVIILIALVGLAFGSFVNAAVWRVHLKEQKVKGKRQKASKSQSRYSIARGRSMCPECRHELAPKDLIPVISWLALRGKCRYCKKSISVSYPLVEVLTAVLAVGSYALWPHTLDSLLGWSLFAGWILVVCTGVALAKYDLHWMILPNSLAYVFNALGALYLLLCAVFENNAADVLINGLAGTLLFSGFFYLLYQVSRGKWIGGGDVRLAVGLGLLLGWQKSILALTLAAYLGTLVVIILVVMKKYHRKMKLPFGPFLLAATYIVFLTGQPLIDWYLRLSGF